MTGKEIEQMNRRERVRACLIRPLAERGMRHQKGRSEDEARAFEQALAVRLAYLEPGDFDALVNWAELNGEGRARDVWPSEIAFVRAAHALRPPPDHMQPMITSWMRSAAGRAAHAASVYHLAASLDYMRRFRRPPNFEKYGVGAVSREAEEMRLAVAGFERAEANGYDRPDLAEEVARIRRLVAEALALTGETADA